MVEDGNLGFVSTGHLGSKRFLQKDVAHSYSAILQKGIQLVFKVYLKNLGTCSIHIRAHEGGLAGE